MKKFLIAAVVGGLALVGLATPAMATTPKKVNVCHWANGNPHIINISVNGLNGHFDDPDHDVVDDPKDVPGHAKDYVVSYGGKDSVTDVQIDACEGQDNPGTPGEDGDTWLPVCVPGVGIRFVLEGSEYVLATGEFLLTSGAVCPLDGEDGDDGTNGTNGTNGTDGNDGEDGADGADGSDGVNGEDGADGATGPAGPQGPAGPAGANGSDGAAGPAGSNGSVTEVTPAPAAGPAPTALPRTGGGSNLTVFAALAILLGGLTTFVSRLIRKDAAQA